MKDKKETMINRLRAAELLGKSQADFIDRHEHTLKDNLYDEFSGVSDEDLLEDIRGFNIGQQN